MCCQAFFQPSEPTSRRLVKIDYRYFDFGRIALKNLVKQNLMFKETEVPKEEDVVCDPPCIVESIATARGIVMRGFCGGDFLQPAIDIANPLIAVL